MKSILKNLNRYKNFLILLMIIGIFGYTAKQLSLAINPTPDPAMVGQQKQAATTGSVRIDSKTIESVNSLAQTSGSSGVTATNKPDPFTQ